MRAPTLIGSVNTATVFLPHGQDAPLHEPIHGPADGGARAASTFLEQAMAEPLSIPLPAKGFPDNDGQHPKFRVAQMRHDAVEKDVGESGEAICWHTPADRSYAQ